MRRFLNSLTSLRLTVVCLCLALILVFMGTIAQVSLGLYEAQARFFHSVFVTWTPPGTRLKIPVFPGGWLLGGILMISLILAPLKYFKVTWKKSGLALIHAGMILLIFGQFFTELFQVESQLRLETGVPTNYAEDPRRNELAIIDSSNPDQDEVVAIPESFLAQKGDIRHPRLPFAVRVKSYFPNARPTTTASKEPGNIKSSQGIGARLPFAPEKASASLDDENKPAAWIEIVSDKGPVGDWIVSTWLAKAPLLGALQEQFGDTMGKALEGPQTFSFGGHSYQLALRPTRYYKPYYITLLEFKHELYPGSDIPRNFSSKIHLSDPQRGDNRDVLIYMNNPMRYRGETFYQASFERGDKVSVLQVVRNPASIAPYISCVLICLGLIVQFLIHLFKFARNRSVQTVRASEPPPVCEMPQPDNTLPCKERSNS